MFIRGLLGGLVNPNWNSGANELKVTPLTDFTYVHRHKVFPQ